MLLLGRTAGFARAIEGTSSGDGWDHLYEISYFYGFFTSLTMHWAFHSLWPAQRQRGSSPFVLHDHAEMIHYGEEESGTPESVTVADDVVEVAKV